MRATAKHSARSKKRPEWPLNACIEWEFLLNDESLELAAAAVHHRRLSVFIFKNNNLSPQVLGITVAALWINNKVTKTPVWRDACPAVSCLLTVCLFLPLLSLDRGPDWTQGAKNTHSKLPSLRSHHPEADHKLAQPRSHTVSVSQRALKSMAFLTVHQ